MSLVAVTVFVIAYALIASDRVNIGLPGLNGFEVAKRLRQQPALQNAVLVAMTGYGRESDRQRSREAGFDHHLVKPGDFGKVLEILATVSESPAR